MSCSSGPPPILHLAYISTWHFLPLKLLGFKIQVSLNITLLFVTCFDSDFSLLKEWLRELVISLMFSHIHTLWKTSCFSFNSKKTPLGNNVSVFLINDSLFFFFSSPDRNLLKNNAFYLLTPFLSCAFLAIHRMFSFFQLPVLLLFLFTGICFTKAHFINHLQPHSSGFSMSTVCSLWSRLI